MTGLLAEALEARKIPSHSGQLESHIDGYWTETPSFVKLTRIHVHYVVRIPRERRAAAERALAVHDSKCAVSNSVRPSIEVTFDAEFIEEGPGIKGSGTA
jgi:organic hydroperoxide reductase OsmC/OhrA